MLKLSPLDYFILMELRECEEPISIEELIKRMNERAKRLVEILQEEGNIDLTKGVISVCT